MSEGGAARDAAYGILQGAPANAALAALSEADAALATEIAQGVLRHRSRIDAELRRHVFLASLPAPLIQTLRIGLYQLRFLDRVPVYAAVDETVRLATRFHQNSRLVNAVLRKLSRAEPPPWPARGSRFLTTTASLPPWLARRWVARYGMERAEQYAQAACAPPGVHLAVNTRLTTPEELGQRLSEEGIQVAPHAEGALLEVLDGNPIRSRALAAGLFYVIGPSSFDIGRAAASVARGPVLDGCAAPGGKLVIMLLSGVRDAVAVDATHSKIVLLRDNLARLRLDPAQLVVADLTQPAPFRRLFRTVLIDAPCSGLGVISKLPEIKWRLREREIAPLAQRQSRLMERCFELVAPGGMLVYSVCSLEPEEGERVVGAFLRRRHDAALAHPRFGFAECDRDGFYRFFPGPGRPDGFFMAILERR